MDKKSKITIVSSVLALAIVTIVVTYAYFSARITGLESASTISLIAGTMGIHFEEGNETVSASNIYPREEAWITKTFTLTGNNTTAIPMEYEVGLQILSNTFKGGQLSFSLEVGNGNVGTSMSSVTNKAITKTSGNMLIGKGSFPGPTTNGVQTYTLKIYFLDTEKDQNINQGAVFNGKITVSEKVKRQIASAPVNECYNLNRISNYQIGEGCFEFSESELSNYSDFAAYASQIASVICSGDTFEYEENGEPASFSLDDIVRHPEMFNLSFDTLKDNNVISNVEFADTDGDNYYDGIYNYTLSYDVDGNYIGDGWSARFDTGWVSDSLATPPCTSIDGIPIISMRKMFAGSDATSIDFSSFNTSNVTDMSYMFYHTDVTTLDLSSFDTSNVTNMVSMFEESEATTLDLSSFDTSKVTNMSQMFYYSYATSLDLSSFDTSNVTNMNCMFWGSQATSIDLSSFDILNVTDVANMFSASSATTLDLSSFDTSNLTSMAGMFSGSAVTSLDLSSFDTSNVTNMTSMFADSAATTLNLSSFDTSKVTNMSHMFSGSAATTLDLSSFDTSNVTNMTRMFYDNVVTTLDLSSFNTSNVTKMSEMFEYSDDLETIYVSDRFVTTQLIYYNNSSNNMFKGCTSLVGGSGTPYDSSKVNREYARIDNPPDNRGYFTYKAN